MKMIKFFVSYLGTQNDQLAHGNMVGLCESRYVTIETIRAWEQLANDETGNQATTVIAFQELVVENETA